MNDWLTELARLLREGRRVVRVVVAGTRGSVPREAGATMLVHADGTSGSIGGGNLELAAIERARQLFAEEAPANVRERYTLGTTLAQCCGGVAEIWWEHHHPAAIGAVQSARQRLDSGEDLTWVSRRDGWTVTPPRARPAQPRDVRADDTGDPGDRLPAGTAAMLAGHDAEAVLIQRLRRDNTPLWLYGAGHVGQAIVRALADLPFDITWIDSRPEIFPEAIADNANRLFAAEPASTVRMAPEPAWFLVLTHSHQQDLAICHEILSRDAHRLTGLIGSHSKAVRFARRLAGAGIPPARLDRLICPIGVSGIRSKAPAAIATAVAAQLLQERERLGAGEHPLMGNLSTRVAEEPA